MRSLADLMCTVRVPSLRIRIKSSSMDGGTVSAIEHRDDAVVADDDVDNDVVHPGVAPSSLFLGVAVHFEPGRPEASAGSRP